jgi:molecular chaperone IbpA
VKAASFENGLLQIELVRELPEAKNPRKIEIRAAGDKSRPPRLIEGRVA